jgi:phenylpropionate dioxygenase-like ring-hydroxylating dioxygenase large terminal subunit
VSSTAVANLETTSPATAPHEHSAATDQAGYDALWIAAARRSWHPVARSRDVGPGAIIPVTLLGERLVVWRSPAGEVTASNRSCVHRGTDLAAGSVTEGGCLRCPYHGWEFSSDGRCMRIPQLGASIPIPTQATQPGVRVREQAGLVWACLVGAADETTAVPPFEANGDVRWRYHQGTPLDWACQAARHTENFCDIGHFSILHTRSFGNPDRSEVDHYRVEGDGKVLRFSYPYPGRDYLDPGRGDVVIDLTYEVHLPFTVILRDINGPGSLIFTAVMPVTSTTSRIFWSSWRIDQDLDGRAVAAAERAILEEDRLIVEGQRPRRMPLARGTELHLGFDRFAVRYRRALAALGYPIIPPPESD